ncbi:hypothetical protein DSO57_1031743 [Entomophthora muscae]|uniref:Uncharacterized protein n=1 Tax=Entomophthora muscae TaxID=34485 RepID=A0ACC2SPQ2_9FUNG|nr:hypothetical protein DSO57_1031743 [Entomophthora muscae]
MHNNHYMPYNSGEVLKPKRKQVKIACASCKASCKKCDEARPCGRCVSRGLGDSCQDSERKVRVKGTRRGPYRKTHKKRIAYTLPNKLPPISSLLASLETAPPSPSTFACGLSLDGFSLNPPRSHQPHPSYHQPTQYYTTERRSSESLPPFQSYYIQDFSVYH